jgi:hypothetical protein
VAIKRARVGGYVQESTEARLEQIHARVARGDIIGLMHSDDVYAHARVLERIAGVGGLGTLAWKNLSKLSQFWRHE